MSQGGGEGMAQDTLADLGPFRGLNNTADEVAPLYARGAEGEPAYLREAINVDLTRDGWLRRRNGRTKLAPLVDGHSLAAVGGLLLAVDDGVLMRIHPGTEPTNTVREPVIAVLGSEPMSYAEIGGEVFWCNGTQAGQVHADGTAGFWGLDPPALPTLTAV